MAVVKGEHDPEWKKFFVAVAPRIMPRKTKMHILGVGTVDDCILLVKDWYQKNKHFKVPVRLVCITGGIVEIVVHRTPHGITLERPRRIPSFINPPPKRIPPSGISIVNPCGIDWHNYYCVVHLEDQCVSPWILAHGSFQVCKKYIDSVKNADAPYEIFTLVSLDGHIYQITATENPQTYRTRLSPTAHIKSWPLLYLWR